MPFLGTVREMLPSACYKQVYRCRQQVQASARYLRIVTGYVSCLTPSPSFCRRQLWFSAEVSNELVLQQTLSLGSTAQHSPVFILSLFLSEAISSRPAPKWGERCVPVSHPRGSPGAAHETGTANLEWRLVTATSNFRLKAPISQSLCSYTVLL